MFQIQLICLPNNLFTTYITQQVLKILKTKMITGKEFVDLLITHSIKWILFIFFKAMIRIFKIKKGLRHGIDSGIGTINFRSQRRSINFNTIWISHCYSVSQAGLQNRISQHLNISRNKLISQKYCGRAQTNRPLL